MINWKDSAKDGWPATNDDRLSDALYLVRYSDGNITMRNRSLVRYNPHRLAYRQITHWIFIDDLQPNVD